MPLIRPISDLRNRSSEISELCHREDQPIFIIGDPVDGKKIVGSFYSMLFAQYIKGLGSKYLIVYTKKEGFRAFSDKDEAAKAMNEHLMSQKRTEN